MLIDFTFENWKSYRDETKFSMIAGRERRHGHRLLRMGKHGNRILPVSAIYGGNASGKSNFLDALQFAKNLVVNGVRNEKMRIPVKPFLLDSSSEGQPSKFGFKIFADETAFDYRFALNGNRVVHERLAELRKTSEKLLYERDEGDFDHDFGGSDRDLVEVLMRATSDNQLFLNQLSHKSELCRPAYLWFRECLELVYPHSDSEGRDRLLAEGHELPDIVVKIIPQLDTGISRFSFERLPLSNLGVNPKVIEDLEEALVDEGKGALLRLRNGGRFMHFRVEREGSELVCHRIASVHEKPDDGEVSFEVGEESDGTVRLFELLPDLAQTYSPGSNKVCVVDEIDRSLHSRLTRQLVEAFLENCGEHSRNQLIFTTHDVMLMNQQLLRRDELWLAERRRDQSSILKSIYDYKTARSDTDLARRYMRGRYGGVPRIFLDVAHATE